MVLLSRRKTMLTRRVVVVNVTHSEHRKSASADRGEAAVADRLSAEESAAGLL